MPSITEAKQRYEERLNQCLSKYSRVLFVSVDNVRSQQLHDVRAALRGKAEFLMGKKTLQAKVVDKRASAKDATPEAILFSEQCESNKLLCGNSGLIFTNEDASEITAILDKFRVKAPARVGAISPCDVIGQHSPHFKMEDEPSGCDRLCISSDAGIFAFDVNIHPGMKRPFTPSEQTEVVISEQESYLETFCQWNEDEQVRLICCLLSRMSHEQLAKINSRLRLLTSCS